MTPNTLPPLVDSYLCQYWVEQKHLAYFFFSSDEILQELGGDVSFYFPQGVECGISALELTPFLAGVIPFDEQQFKLPCLELRDKLYVDLNILKDTQTDRYCVMFLDVTQELENEEKIQQAKNELHLLSEKHQKLLHRHVGDPVINRIMEGKSGLKMEGERKSICSLFVDIRSFTVFNETHDSQEVIYTLNEYLNLMIQAVLEHHGVIDKIVGDGLMALFGVLPEQKNIAPKNIAQSAFEAAQKMQKSIKSLQAQRRIQGKYPLGAGIGIATGSAVLGILGDHERQAFTAIGHHVNLAQRLESQARAGEILIDENSYREIVFPNIKVNQVELQLKGVRDPIKAYSIY